MLVVQNSTLARLIVIPLLVALGGTHQSLGAELKRLTEEMWDEFAPQGKEVDCIYGDHVIRNDQIVAVIAHPVAGRNANMTVRNVGGAIIDMSRRRLQNDQLSAFYVGAARFDYRALEVSSTGDQVTWKTTAQATDGKPEVSVEYRLRDGDPYVHIRSTFTNRSSLPLNVELVDAMRADRSFQFGVDKELNLFWAYDHWWGQAYGVIPEGHTIQVDQESLQRGRPVLYYLKDQAKQVTIQPGETYVLERKLFPAASLLELKGIAGQLVGRSLREVQIEVRDPTGPVAGAKISVAAAGQPYGEARTFADGRLHFALPDGQYEATISALGRPEKTVPINTSDEAEHRVELAACGYVVGQITDDHQQPVACKVEFRGVASAGTANPFFGPDTFEHALHNLYYTHDGRFRQPIGPGSYEVIISHGPEYDAHFTRVEVKPGQDTPLQARLVRRVDTQGWVSTDFHSHSSPSGDNTSSQLGRVLNLLCEHIEFAPCTEHNRISTYVPHLETLRATTRMATCSGIELTGELLPVNHQNAFPLVRRPRTQDGGAPLIDTNPVIQIERLALWDNASDKLVQENHPNIVQVLADRDLDGKYDGGFEKMFGLMDVIEVHPPQSIFSPPPKDQTERERGNTIFHWLQLLNMGYRIPGVVNTDAHYTFHGSGWLRNYLKSSTDNPEEIEVMDMVHAAEEGHVVMTNGPFLEVSLTSERESGQKPAIPGDQVNAPEGKAKLHVRVQCPNWHDVNRVQVFLNGRPAPELNFTRRTHPDRFTNEVVKFDHQIDLDLEGDTHVIVATAGEGLKLGPVMGPEHGEDMPVAVSNPIFVDVNGNGFEPNGDLLDFPLPSANEAKAGLGN